MTKAEIISAIDSRHHELYAWLEEYGEEFWEHGPAGKWNTGQQIKHLVQSERALNRGLGLPKLVLNWQFGKANRPSRQLSAVIERYLEKLSKAGNVVSPFSTDMCIPPVSEREDLIDELRAQQKKMTQLITAKWSETSLDKYVVPHPLMGKMTVREITAWNSYHLDHHLKSIRKNCGQDI